MTPQDVERLLNQTIYSWDVTSLLGGIVDFLEFSEQNISRQRAREVQRAKEEAKALEFEPEDALFLLQARDQIVESAEYRFDIALSQSVRYAGLLAYVTSVEWCSKLFGARLAVPLRIPPRKNGAIHVLEHLNQAVGQRITSEVETFRQVMLVRNCVAHSAGLVKGTQREADTRQAIATLQGFGLSGTNFIGESVHIETGAIEALARSALLWVPSVDEECSSNGTFRPHP